LNYIQVTNPPPIHRNREEHHHTLPNRVNYNQCKINNNVSHIINKNVSHKLYIILTLCVNIYHFQLYIIFFSSFNATPMNSFKKKMPRLWILLYSLYMLNMMYNFYVFKILGMEIWAWHFGGLKRIEGL
jgi:hypothetical protein